MSDKPNDNVQNTETPPEPGANADKPKTFTQDELDRIIADRLKRQKEQFSDYADLKAKAAKWQEQEDAKKSELEKLQAQIADLQNRASEADTKRKATLVRSSVMAEAAKQGVPADRLEAAYKLIDTNTLTIEADDTIPNLSDSVKQLIADNAFLMATQPNGKQPAPKSSPANPASNPAGESQWMSDFRKQYRGGGSGFGKGGVRPPSEE